MTGFLRVFSQESNGPRGFLWRAGMACRCRQAGIRAPRAFSGPGRPAWCPGGANQLLRACGSASSLRQSKLIGGSFRLPEPADSRQVHSLRKARETGYAPTLLIGTATLYRFSDIDLGFVQTLAVHGFEFTSARGQLVARATRLPPDEPQPA